MTTIALSERQAHLIRTAPREDLEGLLTDVCEHGWDSHQVYVWFFIAEGCQPNPDEQLRFKLVGGASP
jgi:hypothetical protein